MSRRTVGIIVSTALLTTLMGAGTATAAQSVVEENQHCVLSLETEEVACYATAAESERAHPTWLIRFWSKTKYRGRSLTVSTPAKCPKRVIKNKGFSDLRRVLVGSTYENWNNRISSQQVRKNCRVKLFDKKKWKGDRTHWLKSRKNLRTVPDPHRNWNNSATSIAFKGV